MDQRAPRGARTLLVVVLLAAVYACYARVLDGELQFDDVRGIVENPAIREMGSFTGSRLLLLMRTPVRALTDLTLALNYRAAGLAVRPYHLVNLALHLGVVLAIVVLALQILRRARWPAPFATAFFAAALFGLHPMQTEAVSYVYQRSEVLASLFYALGLVLSLDGEERGLTRRGAVSSLGALACVILGWASKPVIATFPAALVLCLLAFPLERKGAIRRTAPSLPFWAVTAVFSALLLTGVGAQKHAEVGFALPAAVITPRQYLLTQPRVILTYLRLLAWPSGQNVDWQVRASQSLLEWHTLLAWAAVAAIVACAAWLWWWSARRAKDPETGALARMAAFGIGWFFVLLAPTSSVVPILDLLAEHRVYLASFGLFLPASAGGVLLARRLAPGPRGTMAACALGAALCAALGVALWRRNAVWESAVALWTDSAAKSPGKARPHMNLGYALLQNDPERALGELQVAQRLALAGDRRIRMDELDQDLAGALIGLRRYPEAIVVLERVAARGESAPVLSNLAIARLELGQLDQARALAERVVERWPHYAPAHHTLGQIASIRHDYASALAHFRRAVEIDPDSDASLSSLAVTQQRLGDRAGACATWGRYARCGAPGADENGARMMANLGCP